MEKFVTIEQVFDSSDRILKFKSSVIPGLIFSILGIGFFIISIQTDLPSGSMLYPLFLILGITLIIWGLVTIFNRKLKYKLAQDGQKIYFSEINFDLKEKKELLRILSERKIKELEKLDRSDFTGLQLRIAATPNGSACYTQVRVYIPHEHVEINDVCVHTPDEAKIILNLQDKRK